MISRYFYFIFILCMILVCRSNFPCETVKVLTDHPEEVWFVKFSHNGLMLASGSKDGLIIVWDTSVSPTLGLVAFLFFCCFFCWFFGLFYPL